MATSQLLNDANTDHQIAIVRYSQGRANTLLPYMRQIVDYIEVRLGREGGAITTKKALNQIKSDVNKKLNTIYSKWESEEFESIFRDIVRNELEFQSDSIDAVVTDYAPGNPTQKAVLSRAYATPLLIGAKGGSVDFSSYTTGWKGAEIKRVNDMIVSGFNTSQTTQQIARSINGLKSQRYADGILNISRANIFGMVKTTINHLSSEAKAEFAQENSDLIIGMRWISTLDSKTSDICRDRDQTVYLFKDYGQNYPRPPAHHNCRSTLTPELSDEYSFLKESRTRPAVTEVDGKATAEQVPGTQSYYTWLKNQPAPVQNDALGVTKAKIFRNAGLSTQEFKQAATNQFSQGLSIDQMAAKNKKIASYLQKQA